MAAPVLDQVLAVLRASPAVERVILFGSRARGDHRERSDFDVAVDCPRATRSEWSRMWHAIDELPTLYFIDLVRLDEADPNLRDSILGEGVVIYERERVA